MSFAAGALVKLKSGGPTMIIRQIHSEEDDSLLSRFEATEAKASKKRYVVKLSTDERNGSKS